MTLPENTLYKTYKKQRRVLYSRVQKFAVPFACVASGPARTAPDGLIPLYSLSLLRRGIGMSGLVALPAKRTTRRGVSFASKIRLSSLHCYKLKAKRIFDSYKNLFRESFRLEKQYDQIYAGRLTIRYGLG